MKTPGTFNGGAKEFGVVHRDEGVTEERAEEIEEGNDTVGVLQGHGRTSRQHLQQGNQGSWQLKLITTAEEQRSTWLSLSPQGYRPFFSSIAAGLIHDKYSIQQLHLCAMSLRCQMIQTCTLYL